MHILCCWYCVHVDTEHHSYNHVIVSAPQWYVPLYNLQLGNSCDKTGIRSTMDKLCMCWLICHTFIYVFYFFATWDLLHICVYGFRNFAADFLEKYPTHFISPVRLSGSAVETLFSQFKHTAGGKLSAINYANIWAAHLIKHCASAHHSSVGYQDATFHLSECTLEKQKEIICAFAIELLYIALLQIVSTVWWYEYKYTKQNST